MKSKFGYLSAFMLALAAAGGDSSKNLLKDERSKFQKEIDDVCSWLEMF